ncbi:hypothetical protein GVAV_003513 [Gurleya vavrai]
MEEQSTLIINRVWSRCKDDNMYKKEDLVEVLEILCKNIPKFNDYSFGDMTSNDTFKYPGDSADSCIKFCHLLKEDKEANKTAVNSFFITIKELDKCYTKIADFNEVKAQLLKYIPFYYAMKYVLNENDYQNLYPFIDDYNYFHKEVGKYKLLSGNKDSNIKLGLYTKEKKNKNPDDESLYPLIKTQVTKYTAFKNLFNIINSTYKETITIKNQFLNHILPYSTQILKTLLDFLNKRKEAFHEYNKLTKFDNFARLFALPDTLKVIDEKSLSLINLKESVVKSNKNLKNTTNLINAISDNFVESSSIYLILLDKNDDNFCIDMIEFVSKSIIIKESSKDTKIKKLFNFTVKNDKTKIIHEFAKNIKEKLQKHLVEIEDIIFDGINEFYSILENEATLEFDSPVLIKLIKNTLEKSISYSTCENISNDIFVSFLDSIKKNEMDKNSSIEYNKFEKIIEDLLFYIKKEESIAVKTIESLCQSNFFIFMTFFDYLNPIWLKNHIEKSIEAIFNMSLRYFDTIQKKVLLKIFLENLITEDINFKVQKLISVFNSFSQNGSHGNTKINELEHMKKANSRIDNSSLKYALQYKIVSGLVKECEIKCEKSINIILDLAKKSITNTFDLKQKAINEITKLQDTTKTKPEDLYLKGFQEIFSNIPNLINQIKETFSLFEKNLEVYIILFEIYKNSFDIDDINEIEDSKTKFFYSHYDENGVIYFQKFFLNPVDYVFSEINNFESFFYNSDHSNLDSAKDIETYAQSKFESESMWNLLYLNNFFRKKIYDFLVFHYDVLLRYQDMLKNRKLYSINNESVFFMSEIIYLVNCLSLIDNTKTFDNTIEFIENFISENAAQIENDKKMTQLLTAKSNQSEIYNFYSESAKNQNYKFSDINETNYKKNLIFIEKQKKTIAKNTSLITKLRAELQINKIICVNDDKNNKLYSEIQENIDNFDFFVEKINTDEKLKPVLKEIQKNALEKFNIFHNVNIFLNCHEYKNDANEFEKHLKNVKVYDIKNLNNLIKKYDDNLTAPNFTNSELLKDFQQKFKKIFDDDDQMESKYNEDIINEISKRISFFSSWKVSAIEYITKMNDPQKNQKINLTNMESEIKHLNIKIAEDKFLLKNAIKIKQKYLYSVLFFKNKENYDKELSAFYAKLSSKNKSAVNEKDEQELYIARIKSFVYSAENLCKNIEKTKKTKFLEELERFSSKIHDYAKDVLNDDILKLLTKYTEDSKTKNPKKNKSELANVNNLIEEYSNKSLYDEKPKEILDKIYEHSIEIDKNKNYLTNVINTIAKNITDLSNIKTETKAHKPDSNPQYKLIFNELLKILNNLKNNEAIDQTEIKNVTTSIISLNKDYNVLCDMYESHSTILEHESKINKLYEDNIESLKNNKKINCEVLKKEINSLIEAEKNYMYSSVSSKFSNQISDENLEKVLNFVSQVSLYHPILENQYKVSNDSKTVIKRYIEPYQALARFIVDYKFSYFLIIPIKEVTIFLCNLTKEKNTKGSFNKSKNAADFIKEHFLDEKIKNKENNTEFTIQDVFLQRFIDYFQKLYDSKISSENIERLTNLANTCKLQLLNDLKYDELLKMVEEINLNFLHTYYLYKHLQALLSEEIKNQDEFKDKSIQLKKISNIGITLFTDISQELFLKRKDNQITAKQLANLFQSTSICYDYEMIKNVPEFEKCVDNNTEFMNKILKHTKKKSREYKCRA